MKSATLSSKFQIVIPKEIREEMGYKPGQKLVFIPKAGVLHLVPQMGIEDLFGSLKGADVGNLRDRSDAP